MALERVEVVIPKTEAVAIEYPAFIRNPDRALATLGGLEGIAAAVDATDHLKLKHRPEDRTSHPLYGERSDQLRLLLRIARPRPQAAAAAGAADGGPSAKAAAAAPTSDGDTHMADAADGSAAAGAEGAGTDTDGVRVSIAARVAPTFRFPGLADYAFLPTDPGLATRDRSAVPYDQRPDKAEPTRSLQPLLLIPQLFSWLDLPQDYAFKQFQAKPVAASKASVPHVEPQWGDCPHISFYAEAVPKPATLTTAAAAAAAAAGGGGGGAAAAVSSTLEPASPSLDPGEVSAARAAAAAAGFSDVRAYRLLETEVWRLLGSRPVWGLELLQERCAGVAATAVAMQASTAAAAAATAGGGGGGAGGEAAGAGPESAESAVEKVLQRLSYRFKTGPWRGLYVRRGYDPRSQPESRQYQAVIYSLPNNWYRSLLRTRRKTLKEAARAAAGEASGAPAAAGGAAAATAAEGGKGADGGSKEAGAGEAAAAGEAAEPKAAAGGEQADKAAGGEDAAGAAAAAEGASTGAATVVVPEIPAALLPTCMDDLHNFRALPTSQSCTFQLCDLQLEEVTAALQTPPSTDSRCSEKTGWLSNTQLSAIQTAVQQRFLVLMRQHAPSGAEKVAGGATADGLEGDVEMADAVGTPAAAAVTAGSGRAAAEASPAAAAGGGAAGDEALRSLMEQMNLHAAVGGADGADGAAAAAAAAVAALFGDDDDDEFRLLDEDVDEDAVDIAAAAAAAGVGADTDVEGGAGGATDFEDEDEEDDEEDEEEDEEDEEEAAGRRPGRRRRDRRAKAGAGGGGAAAATGGAGGAAGGTESAYESEFDMGAYYDEEDDEGYLTDMVPGASTGHGGGGEYGRQTVPFDGGASGAGGARAGAAAVGDDEDGEGEGGDYGDEDLGGMFGSEDDDEY